MFEININFQNKVIKAPNRFVEFMHFSGCSFKKLRFGSGQSLLQNEEADYGDQSSKLHWGVQFSADWISKIIHDNEIPLQQQVLLILWEIELSIVYIT